MRKSDKETIIAGAMLLKEYCNNHTNCTSCAFKEVRYEVGCMFDHIPANYDIKALEEKLDYANAKLHLSSVYGKMCYVDTDSVLKGEEHGNKSSTD